MKRLVFLALGAMFACFARADSAFATTQEKGGTFPAGMKVLSGITSYANIVPGSFQISAGGYVWNDDGSGKLVFTDPNAGASSSGNDEIQSESITGSGTILYSSGAWSILINPAMSVSSVATVRYSHYTGDDWSGDYSLYSVQEQGGTFPAGANVLYGMTSYANIVPGSVQIAADGYVWNDDGNGALVFTDPYGGTPSSGNDETTSVIQNESGPTTDGERKLFSWTLQHANVKPGSVSVALGGSAYFSDNGDGTLSGLQNAYKGNVSYDSGAISVVFPSVPLAGEQFTVSYTYRETPVVSATLSGSGTILYPSGAWTIQINPAMAAAQSVTVRYSYYIENTAVFEVNGYGEAWESAVVDKRTWSFVPSDDGKTCAVVGVYPANGKLAIPAKLGGLAVTHVDATLFRNASSMTTLSIPAGVKSIDYGHYGFGSRSGYFPFGVEDNAFSSCAKLQSIKVASGNKVFSSANGVLFDKKQKTLYAVPPAKKGAYRVPTSVRTIARCAFRKSSLSAVALPKKLARIEPDAFQCGALRKLAIPASVTEIGEHAFAPRIQVLVSTKSQSFAHASGGVLFDRKKTRLLHCPSTWKGSFKAPATLETVDALAFEGCSGITKIALGKKVRWIGYGAFRKCRKLASIGIPGKVTADCYNAYFTTWFQGSPALKAISLPHKGVCAIEWLQAGLPAPCKVAYRDKTPVYWIRFLPNGGERTQEASTTYSSYSHSIAHVSFSYSTVTTSPSDSDRILAFRGKDRKLPANRFRRTGYVFAGWATKPGGAVKYKNKAIVKNIAAAGRTATLYAVWKPVKTTYKFNANGGSGSMAALAVGYGGRGQRLPDVTLYAIWTQDALSFSSDGDAPWFETAFGEDPCFESGAIGDGESSVLTATVDGPGALAFRWMASSEEGRDIAFFSVDDQDLASRSGLDDDWTTVSLRVEGDGPHVLSWTYAKDDSGSDGDDCARLADIVWIAD